MFEGPNYCSREGAFVLKLKIEAYWRERGQVVHVNLCDAGFHYAIRCNRVDLRSDMMNGLPRTDAALPLQEAA
ncbi:MAG: phosphoglycolate phosphatase [Hyphomonadaceae bacterium]